MFQEQCNVEQVKRYGGINVAIYGKPVSKIKISLLQHSLVLLVVENQHSVF